MGERITDTDFASLAISQGRPTSGCRWNDDSDMLRSDRNNNSCSVCTNSPSTAADDLYSPSSSSDKDSQLSPDAYPDEEFYGKLKVKVRKDGKKLTEKRRRQDLQQQYNNLRLMVPGLLNVEGRTPFSRNVILKNTLKYIEHLKVCVSSSYQLENELRLVKEYNLQLERELQMWQEKVDELRRRKQKKSAEVMTEHAQQAFMDQSDDSQRVT